MYLSFFGLQHEPFSIAPDPRFLFMSARHREALAHLRYGLDGGGFVVLTGEIGAGKTTICRCLLEQIPDNCTLAYLFNPKLTVRELLQSICSDFGIHVPRAETGTASIKDYIDALNGYLLASHAAGKHSVLIIDEAQGLSAHVLEQLRLLTNLETTQRKLLQIVLIGQPELRDMLNRPELEQLAQRVVARYHLGTLSRGETEQYILHRLAVAGLSAACPFNAGARARIHQLSHGVPRRINLLCDRALLGAYAEGTRRITRRIVDKAAAEVFGAPDGATRKPPRWSSAIGVAAGAALAAGLALAWQAWRGPGEPRLGSATAAAAGQVRSAQSAGGSMPAAGMVTSAAAASAPVPASASGSAASAPGAAPARWLDAEALAAELRRAPRAEAQAWRELAAAWKLDGLVGDPCMAAQERQTYCLKRRVTLELLRRFDRPAILPLYAADGQVYLAQLIGLSEQGARLRLGDLEVQVKSDVLAAFWRGEMGTLWRGPAGLRIGAQGANVEVGDEWLVAQLARADATAAADAGSPAAVRAAVREFQRRHGLQADGLAGTATLMILNRALGVDEPRLQR